MMRFPHLHCQKTVEIRSAKKIKECAFYAVCEIVSENQLIDMMFFCVGFEFSVSPISQFRFRRHACRSGRFFLARPFYDDGLRALKKVANKLFVSVISCPGMMITMYKKQVL